jgi:hypothetical protein
MAALHYFSNKTFDITSSELGPWNFRNKTGPRRQKHFLSATRIFRQSDVDLLRCDFLFLSLCAALWWKKNAHSATQEIVPTSRWGSWNLIWGEPANDSGAGRLISFRD